jgi:fatty acid desaturase
MKRNEGTIDRVLRVVVAIAAVAGAAALGFASVWGIVLLVVAGVMAVTAAVGFCPLYAVFGISSCPVRTQVPERTKVTAS